MREVHRQRGHHMGECLQSSGLAIVHSRDVYRNDEVEERSFKILIYATQRG
jgi:hypothetical protein